MILVIIFKSNLYSNSIYNRMNQNDDCNYLDANTQNASDMNLNCVNNALKGQDK